MKNLIIGFGAGVLVYKYWPNIVAVAKEFSK